MFPRFHATLLTLLFVALTTLASCTTTFSPPPKDAGGFVWEATKGDKVLTLVGTMHLGIKESEISPLIWKRLEAADVVVTETNLSEMNRELLQKYMTLPKGQDLEVILGKKDFARVKTEISRAFPYTTDSNLHAMSLLAVGTQLMLASVKNAVHGEEDPVLMKAVDTLITEKADQKKKTMRFLETLEEQLSRLEKALTVDEIRRMLEESGDEEDAYIKLRDAYRRSEPRAINLMIDELPADQRTLLLDERNENWMRKLPSLVTHKHTVIAVGAAHFGGPKSLQSLLEKDGWKVVALLPQ